jgi:hypothetical protein
VKLCREHLTLPAAAKADFMAAAISKGLAPASAIDLEEKIGQTLVKNLSTICQKLVKNLSKMANFDRPYD